MRYTRKDGVAYDSTKEEPIKPFDEKFLFLRETDGFKWMNEVTFNELKLLIALTKNGTYKSEVEVGDRVRAYVDEMFGMSYQTMRRALNGLEDKRFIIKKNGTTRTYLILPATLYKGRSSEVGELIYNFLYYNKKQEQ